MRTQPIAAPHTLAMALVQSPSGPVLLSNLGEQLTRVRSLFARGPNAPLNYQREFDQSVSMERQKAMESRGIQPAPAGPSL